MKNPEEIVKYEEAGRWFRYLGKIRRTTIVLVFTVSGASIGLLGEEFPQSLITPTAIWVSFFNFLFVGAGILQEMRLYCTHSALSNYMRSEENGKGPFVASTLCKDRYSTHGTFLSVFSLLVAFWVIVFILAVCHSVSDPSSN